MSNVHEPLKDYIAAAPSVMPLMWGRDLPTWELVLATHGYTGPAWVVSSRVAILLLIGVTRVTIARTPALAADDIARLWERTQTLVDALDAAERGGSFTTESSVFDFSYMDRSYGPACASIFRAQTLLLEAMGNADGSIILFTGVGSLLIDAIPHRASGDSLIHWGWRQAVGMVMMLCARTVVASLLIPEPPQWSCAVVQMIAGSTPAGWVEAEEARVQEIFNDSRGQND